MVNIGSADVYVDEDDDWTVFTADGSPSAQWEIMVLYLHLIGFSQI